jgi:hypothetical protein
MPNIEDMRIVTLVPALMYVLTLTPELKASWKELQIEVDDPKTWIVHMLRKKNVGNELTIDIIKKLARLIVNFVFIYDVEDTHGRKCNFLFELLKLLEHTCKIGVELINKEDSTEAPAVAEESMEKLIDVDAVEHTKASDVPMQGTNASHKPPIPELPEAETPIPESPEAETPIPELPEAETPIPELPVAVAPKPPIEVEPSATDLTPVVTEESKQQLDVAANAERLGSTIEQKGAPEPPTVEPSVPDVETIQPKEEDDDDDEFHDAKASPSPVVGGRKPYDPHILSLLHTQFLIKLDKLIQKENGVSSVTLLTLVKVIFAEYKAFVPHVFEFLVSVNKDGKASTAYGVVVSEIIGYFKTPHGVYEIYHEVLEIVDHAVSIYLQDYSVGRILKYIVWDNGVKLNHLIRFLMFLAGIIGPVIQHLNGLHIKNDIGRRIVKALSDIVDFFNVGKTFTRAIGEKYHTFKKRVSEVTGQVTGRIGKAFSSAKETMKRWLPWIKGGKRTRRQKRLKFTHRRRLKCSSV